MPNLVCTGAELQCSMGSSSASFSATGQLVTAGAAVGVVSDIGAASVPTFGSCSSPSNPQVSAANGAPQPCLPVIPAPWSPGSSVVTLGGVAALDDSCQCQCTWAGVITVSSAGQTAATDS